MKVIINKATIELNQKDCSILSEIIDFALDCDAIKHCMTENERLFAKQLQIKLDEMEIKI